jgi:hypothetical protein
MAAGSIFDSASRRYDDPRFPYELMLTKVVQTSPTADCRSAMHSMNAREFDEKYQKLFEPVRIKQMTEEQMRNVASRILAGEPSGLMTKEQCEVADKLFSAFNSNRWLFDDDESGGFRYELPPIYVGQGRLDYEPSRINHFCSSIYSERIIKRMAAGLSSSRVSDRDFVWSSLNSDPSNGDLRLLTWPTHEAEDVDRRYLRSYTQFYIPGRTEDGGYLTFVVPHERNNFVLFHPSLPHATYGEYIPVRNNCDRIPAPYRTFDTETRFDVPCLDSETAHACDDIKLLADDWDRLVTGQSKFYVSH